MNIVILFVMFIGSIFENTIKILLYNPGTTILFPFINLGYTISTTFSGFITANLNSSVSEILAFVANSVLVAPGHNVVILIPVLLYSPLKAFEKDII